MSHPPQAPPNPDPVVQRVLQSLERFLHIEAVSGAVLLIVAVAALAWANSPWAPAYEALWHAPFTFGIGTLVVSQPLHFWVNDGLMTVFFLVVGLEIRREMHDGTLATVRAAALPVAAAVGGILAPAIIYLALNAAPPGREGWAIPTATDIAFAVGVLALLGKRIPPAVRILLLALAIIDDIAAILAIALFYSSGIKVAGLAIALVGVFGVWGFHRLTIRSALAYTLPGAVLWFGLLAAGVHPTLAGVVLGLLTPVVPLAGRENALRVAGQALKSIGRQENSRDSHELMRPYRELTNAQLQLLPPVVRVQATLHPWVAYGVMPLFALANAGVSIGGLGPTDPVARNLGLGIVLGLVLGKPLGILGACVLAVRLRWCTLPDGVTWPGLFVVGCLGGIGFTMSIFIAALAFADESLLAVAKLAVLVASALAAVLGLTAGVWLFRSAAAKQAVSDE
jgi:Na+:H+ antiporter, NhaA family